VRLGKYKLVQYWKQDQKDNWELYDMETDHTEMNDLAASMPEKVAEMKALYEKWAENKKVIPWEEVRQIIQAKKETD